MINMMEVNFKDTCKSRKVDVEKGQVRYNDKGMYVLIVKASLYTFDAIVLNKGFNTEQFSWNSRGQDAETIQQVYPYVTEARIEVDR